MLSKVLLVSALAATGVLGFGDRLPVRSQPEIREVAEVVQPRTTKPPAPVSTEPTTRSLVENEWDSFEGWEFPATEEPVVAVKEMRMQSLPVEAPPEVPFVPYRGEDQVCPEWHELALRVGWDENELPKLSYVMWRESRCEPDAINSDDPASGSRGLIQINGFWCRKNQYTEKGWLQDQGILSTCEDLFDPETNLRAGLAIWLHGVDKHRCGWGPWAMKCRR
jgi:hypothetical protein